MRYVSVVGEIKNPSSVESMKDHSKQKLMGKTFVKEINSKT